MLMVKVYESKSEAHCWFIPLKEVLASHAQTSEALKTGMYATLRNCGLPRPTLLLRLAHVDGARVPLADR